MTRLIFDDYIRLCVFLKTKQFRNELGAIRKIQKINHEWHVIFESMKAADSPDEDHCLY